MLRPLSSLWGILAATRVRLYRAGWLSVHRLRRPVVSIGSLGVGGIGKTPCVAALAGILQACGYRPAILSRGYRRRGRAPVVVSRGSGLEVDVRDAGDEPAWLASVIDGVGVAVAARRERAAEILESNAEFDVYLLDDGFQHVRVYRDVDLLVVDGRSPFWEGLPPPAGRLREAPAAARRADAFLLIRDVESTARAALERRHPGIPAFDLEPEPAAVWPLELFPGDSAAVDVSALPSPAYAFAGIARPERFEMTLVDAGVSLTGCRWYRDHQWYDRATLADLAGRARDAGAQCLVTTEKDAARIRASRSTGLPIWVWRHRLAPREPERLGAWLREQIPEPPARREHER